ncbi:MerR family transcriptional regulator [Microbacterium sp. EST19A]|uniref:helix-turn-helix domain-containing protein n=1 Tax=Microbacterium sp. EST19A TaxID=2862681 RepID=UPI001CBF5B27|nr:MerR family transcriptional regulator [Microbacterium sp. EST19A]
MAWSTRELAELGGTSLRAVRHYHEQGLLDEPERLANGYKVYRTQHLVRLVQIRRLSALGLALKQIAAINDGPPEENEAALDMADGELRAAIARLEKARAELAEFRRLLVPADMPPRLSAAANAAKISPQDRALYAVLAQLYGEESAEYWQQIMEASARDAVAHEFDTLTDDASEATRERIAAHFAEQASMLDVELEHPESMSSPGQRRSAAAVIDVLVDVYTPVQLDVLERMWRQLGATPAE